MSDQKCSETADKWRTDGNELFRQGEFLEALTSYNKSVCYAIDGVSLAYANRSAVYFVVKQYEKCLENIELARKHEYPAENAQKLNEREEKCKKLAETHRANPENDPWNFFKLSHPANEKIPFIANCLELRENEKFGRYIVTNSDLKPGDIIAIEEPFYKCISRDFAYSRCAHCLKSNMLSLVPCGLCANSESTSRSNFSENNFSFSLSDVLFERVQSCARESHSSSHRVQ